MYLHREMEVRYPFSGLLKMFDPIRGDYPLTDRTNAALTSSLYARPIALVLGAVSGVLSTIAAALISRSPLLFSLGCVLGAVTILRLTNALHLANRARATSPAKLEFTYRIGAYSYSVTLGVIAAACLAIDLPSMIQVLLITHALGYGIGICVHNAARPNLALAQLALVCLPTLATMLWMATPASLLLAANIILLFPAMGAITFTVFRTLCDSLVAAEKSAELAQQMENLALTDPVTGLANRTGLNRQLERFAQPAGDDAKLAVFWIDLKRFKEINDIHGHQAGDQILHEIGARLRKLVSPQSVVSRFAGDEFVLVCPGMDRHSASTLASMIIGEIVRPIRIAGERFHIDSSIGIAVRPDDGATGDELIQHADIALYEAKAAGNRQIRFFEESMTRSLAFRRDIEAELRLALQRDELSVYFQPIVDLRTGRIKCFEALVRWFHPLRGEIRPDVFIPIAEECGAIVTLGNWLTGRAAQVAAQWPEEVRLAVNLSPLQIKAPGAAFGILSAIKGAGLSPERLELEVTENLFLADSPEIGQFIEEISKSGVRFSLDDFGTGYSSLAYINQWPFSKIKVDRSFISGAQAGLKSDAIIRAVSQMGKSLGIDIVAEGLETIEQVLAVRAAGCNLGQGYHFSRAVPDYQAAVLLAEDRDSATDALHQLLVG